jgi:hypothetical protein
MPRATQGDRMSQPLGYVRNPLAESMASEHTQTPFNPRPEVLPPTPVDERFLALITLVA